MTSPSSKKRVRGGTSEKRQQEQQQELQKLRVIIGWKVNKPSQNLSQDSILLPAVAFISESLVQSSKESKWRNHAADIESSSASNEDQWGAITGRRRKTIYTGLAPKSKEIYWSVVRGCWNSARMASKRTRFDTACTKDREWSCSRALEARQGHPQKSDNRKQKPKSSKTTEAKGESGDNQQIKFCPPSHFR